MALLTLAPRTGAIYQQIVDQLRRLIALGVLRPGDQLPTAKQMAIDLIINPNTVTRAYRELERDGLLSAVPGRGTFVRSDAAKAGAHAKIANSTKSALLAVVREARAIGLSRRDLSESFANAVNACYSASRSKAVKKTPAC